MSGYHFAMMNIQPLPASKIVGDVRSYSEGHKAARHVAAEIATRADLEIEGLKRYILRLMELNMELNKVAATTKPQEGET